MSPLYLPSVDAQNKSIRACSDIQFINGDLTNIPGGHTMVDGSLNIAPIYVPQSKTITGVAWMQTAVGDYTADNNNRVGLYTSDGTNLDLVASCANDAALWSNAGVGLKTKAFTATYGVTPGWYYIGHLYNNSAQNTAPAIARHNTVSTVLNAVFGNDGPIGGSLAAQTDLPAETAISGLTASTQIVWWGLY